MREKTLLYGALAATMLAAGFGVYKARQPMSQQLLSITPVSRLDSARVARAEVPIRLTSADGSGLRLVSIRASAAIEDPIALTELHLEFENPEDRILEGTFRIALPQGASLSRFAMKIDDRWQEGEVVEKQRAREAYEDALHRRQDPALLEQAGGNEFTARVFPIPARGRKQIVIAYTEVLESGAPYTLPLRGLPAVGAIDIDVRAHGGTTPAIFGLHQNDVTPTQDFIVDPRTLPRSPGLQNGNLVIARVVPFATSRPDPISNAVILVDTSASRALGITEQSNLVLQTIGRLPPDAAITVACFDQETVPIYSGPARGFDAKAARAIIDRKALGASNFEQAIAWAGDEAKKKNARRIIFVGDGVATAGATDTQAIKAHVEKLRAAKVERIDAIAIGGIRDDGFLRSIVRGVLDHDGAVLDAQIGADGLARRLGEATASGIPVKVAGATWSYPTTLDGMQAGDEVMVYAEVAPNQGPLRIEVGGQTFTPDLRSVDRPLVERAWAQAKIQSLIEAPHQDATATRSEIIALSTKHRVVSPYTAMVVLETDADYARFGFDRNATRDILTVQDGRVSLTTEPPKFAASLQEQPKADTVTTTPTVMATATAVASASAAPVTPPVSALEDGKKREKSKDSVAKEDPSVVEKKPELKQGEGEKNAVDDGIVAKTQAESPPPPPPPSNKPKPATGTKSPAEPRAGQGWAGGVPPPVPTPNPTVATTPPPTPRPTATATASGRFAGPRQRTPKNTTTDEETRRALEALQQAQLEGGEHATDRDAPADATQARAQGQGQQQRPAEKPQAATPYTGRFGLVMSMITRGAVDEALGEAERWRTEDNGDVLALVALGEAYEAKGDVRNAARAYGSILELWSSRADMRRFAGERLERLYEHAKEKPANVLGLAIDTFGKSVEERPDHPNSHRLYAFALLKHGEHEKAFEAMRAGATRTYPEGRFRGVDRILREDLGLIASAWTHAQPARQTEIHTRLKAAGGHEENGPSLRFVLSWETDANDVDFHIFDARGGHAYFSQKDLPSGGSLYADVTTGYGPECFTVRGPRERRSYPYTLQAHYYSRGPMGYGLGKLQLVEHDGKGNLTFEERPFVVMADHAYVDLGTARNRDTAKDSPKNEVAARTGD